MGWTTYHEAHLYCYLQTITYREDGFQPVDKEKFYLRAHYVMRETAFDIKIDMRRKNGLRNQRTFKTAITFKHVYEPFR